MATAGQNLKSCAGVPRTGPLRLRQRVEPLLIAEEHEGRGQDLREDPGGVVLPDGADVAEISVERHGVGGGLAERS